MIPFGGSYICYLCALSRQYCQPYTALVTETGFDGAILCGVDLELPQFELIIPRQRYFFWSTVTASSALAYEQSALQAVAFLHRLYRFSLV